MHVSDRPGDGSVALAVPPTVRSVATVPALLGFASIANDRPLGGPGPAAPGTVLVRSDLARGLVAAREAVHTFGAVLPLWSAAPRPDPLTATDELDAVGRRLRLLPTAGLTDPLTDGLVLGRRSGSPRGRFTVWARPDVAARPTATLPEVELETAAFEPGTGAPVVGSPGPLRVVELAPVLAPHGWIAASVEAAPRTPSDTAWASLVCVAGLLPGLTRLRDELAVVHPSDRIVGSPFADRLDHVWDGSAFVAP